MLQVDGIQVFYGQSQALFSVSLEISKGEVVTLLGRNGMGKSTTIRAVMGMVPLRAGRIRFRGEEINGLPSYRIARKGIGLVPEGRQVFPTLSVAENLLVTAANHRSVPDPYRLEDVLVIFPRLKDRLSHYGNQLSGGEQQMVAIARALMTNPCLLLLDEATEGLAPLIRKEIWRGLRILKQKGLAILVVDKNLEDLFAISDKHYILEKGELAWSGATTALRNNSELKVRYLGV